MGSPFTAAVIGAGPAGLACARSLHDSGVRVTVFEKARGPGGRLSSRRATVPELGPGPLRFDHGAPHLEARDPAFRAVVDRWRERGLVVEREVARGIVRDGALHLTGERFTRLVGVPAMSALCRDLGEGVPLQAGCRIQRVEHDGARWSLVPVEGAVIPGFDRVAVTAPAPQAAVLLAAAPELAARAKAATYTGCRAVMAAFAERAPLEVDAAKVDGSAIGWISRESAKPGRPAAEAWVLQATPEWSDAHAELDPEAAAARLLAAWREFAGPLGPVFVQSHRWLYARVDTALDETCLFDGELGIGAAGDWCGGRGVEAAYLSGTALAKRILETR